MGLLSDTAGEPLCPEVRSTTWSGSSPRPSVLGCPRGRPLLFSLGVASSPLFPLLDVFDTPVGVIREVAGVGMGIVRLGVADLEASDLVDLVVDLLVTDFTIRDLSVADFGVTGFENTGFAVALARRTASSALALSCALRAASLFSYLDRAIRS